MRILKFGGTSVQDATHIENLIQIINVKEKQVIVLSAVSGITDYLSNFNNKLAHGACGDAIEIAYLIINKFDRIAIQLFRNKPAVRVLVQLEIRKAKDLLLNACYDNDQSTNLANKILSLGETLTTFIFYHLLIGKEIPAKLLYSDEYIRLSENGEADVDFLKSTLAPVIKAATDPCIFIMQGFICSDHQGRLSNLKRGGSDYSASLIGAALAAEEIQIWTDIDGMHNNDPRYVANTQAVRNLSYNEAAELAYFGAKILHPQTILPAQMAHIPVRIKNTMCPNAAGTLIGNSSPASNIKAVAAKSNITHIKIRSGRMLMAHGFLRKVFEIFEQCKTPIDMITTSEVSVSLTIDKTDQLETITKKLQELGTIEVFDKQVIICIVGDFLKNQYGRALSVLDSLANVPVSMISYGGSNNSISILVSEEDKIRALNNLQLGLFMSKKPTHEFDAVLN